MQWVLSKRQGRAGGSRTAWTVTSHSVPRPAGPPPRPRLSSRLLPATNCSVNAARSAAGGGGGPVPRRICPESWHVRRPTCASAPTPSGSSRRRAQAACRLPVWLPLPLAVWPEASWPPSLGPGAPNVTWRQPPLPQEAGHRLPAPPLPLKAADTPPRGERAGWTETVPRPRVTWCRGRGGPRARARGCCSRALSAHLAWGHGGGAGHKQVRAGGVAGSPVGSHL